MNPAPLQLERHFFTKVALDSHPDGQPNVLNHLQCEIEIGQAEDNSRRFQVVLRVKLLSDPEKQTTYTGEIHAVGLFQVVAGWPDNEVNRLVEANGTALLYGAIREMLLNLTARGPWPPVPLTTLTFVPVNKEPNAHLEPKGAASAPVT
ncbi:MAG: protein-export chaperone SecB [Limisphaerales bacterium]